MSGPYWKRIIPALLLTSSVAAIADTVTTTDGTTINGKIIKIHQEKMELKTTFSTNIILNMDMVKSFKTDESVRVKTDGNQELEGAVTSNDSGLDITTGKLKADLDGSKVKLLWMPGEVAPDFVEPFKKEWKFRAGLDWLKKTGNTDEENLGADIVATLEGEDDTTKLYSRYTWKKTEGNKTEDELIIGADYEQRFGTKSLWYVRGEYESDEFELIDVRTTFAGGYGYYFMQEENLKLRGRLGAFMRNESYTDNTENYDTYGLDVGLRLDYTKPDAFGWYTDLNWTPSVENFGKYRLTHESALNLPIGSTDWSFKLGIRQDYNTEATKSASKLDNTYFSRLELNF